MEEEKLTMEDEVRKIICELYDCIYTGKLSVKPLEPVGYDMVMELHSDERPLHVAAELPKGDFLKYIREELRSRHLATDHYYEGYRYDLPPVNPCDRK